VINKQPENAFVINETEQNAFVINAFVINSTFPMAPEDGGQEQLNLFAKEMSIEEGAVMADPPSNKVRVTLRAYQLKDSETITNAGQPLFNPSTEEGGWVPSAAVAETSCEGDCFTVNGPNLIPDSTLPPNQQLTVDRCGALTFDPGTFIVSNPNEKEGTTDAITREKVAEGEPGPFQRHGFFLRDFDAEGNPVDRFLGEFTAPKTLAVGASISNLEAIVLDIPADIEEGTYTLVFFADHPLLVSEYNEIDNTLEFPIVIEAGAQFEGLQAPLLEPYLDPAFAYGANSGSAVPLKWQYVNSSGAPVDSSDADPVVTFEGWFGPDCSIDRSGTPDISFTEDEDPGASGLRYSDGTWQFNWQTKYPDGHDFAGDPLPDGCFEITITSSFTCEEEVDGPYFVELN
jgi:hypothetical protein